MRKKIILTTEQFTKLCEEDNNSNNRVLYTPNDSNLTKTINDGVKQLRQDGISNGTLTITKNVDAINGNIEQSKTLNLNAGKGTSDEIAKVKQQAQSNGLDTNKVNYQINVVNGKPMENSLLNNESKRYTKKMLEDIRIQNLKENSNVYSKEQLNKEFINEASNSNLKRKYINFLYNTIKPLTNKMYKDDNWGAVSVIYKKIEEALVGKGEIEMWVENGGYWKRMGEFPNYKEYKLKVVTNEGVEINGSLKCHSAGTIEDTFKYYDITVTLW